MRNLLKAKQPSRGRTFSSLLLHNFIKIDQYSETIAFNFDGGNSRFKTLTGATMTALLTILIVMYGVFRMHSMFTFVNANIQMLIVKNFFDETT